MAAGLDTGAAKAIHEVPDRKALANTLSRVDLTARSGVGVEPEGSRHTEA